MPRSDVHRSTRKVLLCATAIPLLMLGACADGGGLRVGAGSGGAPSGSGGSASGPSSPSGPSGSNGPTGSGPTGSINGPIGSISLGGTDLTGPNGSGTLIGVNVTPQSSTPGNNGGLVVDVLTGDGRVVQVVTPTTAQQTAETLAPAGSLVGAVLGQPAGGAVMQVTDGLAPTVATVTGATNSVLTPVVDTVNGALGPAVAAGGTLSPVTGAVSQVVDTVSGVLGSGSGAAPSYDGPLLAVGAGNTTITGSNTPDTLASVNLLSQGPNTSAGTLATADVLADGSVLDVTLPATTAGVEAGLAPAGTLAGTLLGEQVGGAVTQVTNTAAPVVAPSLRWSRGLPRLCSMRPMPRSALSFPASAKTLRDRCWHPSPERLTPWLAV